MSLAKIIKISASISDWFFRFALRVVFFRRPDKQQDSRWKAILRATSPWFQCRRYITSNSDLRKLSMTRTKTLERLLVLLCPWLWSEVVLMLGLIFYSFSLTICRLPISNRLLHFHLDYSNLLLRTPSSPFQLLSKTALLCSKKKSMLTWLSICSSLSSNFWYRKKARPSNRPVQL